MASTPVAVREMLVEKSPDYAGRPKTYSIEKGTLGRRILCNCDASKFLIKSAIHLQEKCQLQANPNVKMLMSRKVIN